MTAITFPNSPSSGDTHTAGNGIVYTYDGEKWTSIGTNSAGTWTRSGTEVSLTNAGDDLNVDSGTLFVDASTDRVGIGTTLPTANLHGSVSSGNFSTILESTATSGESSLVIGGKNSSGTVRKLSLKYDNSDLFRIGTAQAVPIRFETSDTERMRIDSSGNVGIGETSLTHKFTVKGAYETLRVIRDHSSYYPSIKMENNSGIGGVIDAIGDVPGGGLRFFGWSNNSATERMRIDSSGNVMIGTSIPGTGGGDELTLATSGDTGMTIRSGTTSVGGIYFADGTSGSDRYRGWIEYRHNSDYMRFGTNDAERAQFNQHGFFKASNAGTYLNVNGYYHEFYQNIDNNSAFVVYHAGNSGTQYGIYIGTGSDQNNASNYFLACEGAGTTRAVIRSNGGLANYSSNNANLCDEREKKNIEPLDSTWNCLKHWELKKFHYNEDADTDDKRYGVIAQQVAPHCPEVITDWIKQQAKDAELDQDGNVITPAQEKIARIGVKEQQMMWMAIKALQEAQDRIETLEAKVAALEAS